MCAQGSTQAPSWQAWVPGHCTPWHASMHTLFLHTWPGEQPQSSGTQSWPLVVVWQVVPAAQKGFSPLPQAARHWLALQVSPVAQGVPV